MSVRQMDEQHGIGCHASSNRPKAARAKLAERYQKAWNIAQRSEEVLLRDFGATRVAVFGSLVSPPIFHIESDVDLAIWGIAQDEFDRAQKEIPMLVPGFPVDLVRVESASPGLQQTLVTQFGDTCVAQQRDKWMDSEPDRLGEGFGQSAVVLAARLRSELADVRLTVERAQRLLQKAEASEDQDWWDGIALNLHSFYTGVEKIFEEVAKEIDGGLPSGADWHQRLLIQMEVELPGRRPAVIRRATRDCLDEYRSFRHAVRNLYTFLLQPTRLRELVERSTNCLQAVAQDMETFCGYLQQIGVDPS